jgi:hypothetical protein
MECIEILDSDEEAAKAAEAPPESDDDVEIVGGAPAPVPDSQDSEVQILDDAADLSEGAQAKLLKSLLAEKQQLAQQVASLQKKTSDDKRTKRPVYWRRDGDGKRLPDDAGVDEKLMVELTPGSDEYESVAARLQSRGLPDANISSIKRCVNDHLWAPYAARREAMARRSTQSDEDRVWRSDVLPGVLNEAENPVCLPDANPCRERYLFHGAAPSTIDCILDENVDFRLSQITGAMGACAYFADQSSYSDQYCRMPDHSALVRHRHAGTAARPQDSLKMLVCRVLLGECGRGQPGLRRPPAIGGSGRLNDSVSNNPDTVDDCASQGSMYGVFDNAQVYPEYVIEYKRDYGTGGGGRFAAALAGLPPSLLAGIPGMPAAVPRRAPKPPRARKPAAKKTAKKRATTKRKSPRKKQQDDDA